MRLSGKTYRQSGYRTKRISKILVAEDEPELLRFYKVLLEDMGHEVVTVTDGQECIEAYRKGEGFDLVILDHKIPIKTGMEVAIEIAADAPSQQLLMITAYAGVLDLAQKPDNLMIMSKPFELDQLTKTIQGILNAVKVQSATAKYREQAGQ